MDLGVSGLASGFDWRALVEQLMDLERAPQQRLRSEQGVLQLRNTAYRSILSQLQILKNRVESLSDPALYASRVANSSDATIATAAVGGSAVLGTYAFNVKQLATASLQHGTANAGARLSATDDVSSVVVGTAAFSAPVTAGTFTVNGAQVTIATTDTLQSVFDKISTATGGAVTATYNSSTDRITLSSGSPILLGSANDSSNFLQAARLYNNGTGAISSTSALGVVRLNAALADANFLTAVTDGGSGAGEFKINGVSIRFNAATDTAADVLARINNSAAGVSASYDAVNDRFVLANKQTGDLGLALEDVTGNFLAASGLSGGSLTRGASLIYTVNGGGEIVSHSNTITEATSGIAGLTVTAVKTGAVSIEVTSDTAKIRTAITDFIAEYNKSQTLIATQTAVSTNAQGNVTAGNLAGEHEANEFATRLRQLVNSAVSSLSGPIRQLAALGIDSNGNDDTLALTNGAALDTALVDNLEAVRELFTNSTNGLSTRLAAYLDRTIGDEGTLTNRQSTLTRQIAAINTQVSELERRVQANRAQLIQSFIAMETAQARINQQLAFLAQRLGIPQI